MKAKKKKPNAAYAKIKKKVTNSKVARKWLSAMDASAYLGISYVQIHRLITANKVPVFKIGKLWKFKASDLDKWIESRKS